MVAQDRSHSLRWAVAWNLFGALDLIVAPATALLFRRASLSFTHLRSCRCSSDRRLESSSTLSRLERRSARLRIVSRGKQSRVNLRRFAARSLRTQRIWAAATRIISCRFNADSYRARQFCGSAASAMPRQAQPELFQSPPRPPKSLGRIALQSIPIQVRRIRSTCR
jgi:hypothetical protein